MQTKSVLLRNMFNAEEYVLCFFYGLQLTQLIRETEAGWDKDLAEDVKGECESKYGQVLAIKVDKDSQV